MTIKNYVVRNRKRLFIIFSFISGLLFLGLAITTINFDDVLTSFSTTPLLLSSYIFVQLCLMFLLTLRWRVVLNSQGINVNFFKLNNYRLVGQAKSFLTPAGKVGGESLRANLLSVNKNVPFRKALSGVVIDKSVDFSTSGIFFLVGASIALMSLATTIWITLGFLLLFGLFLYLLILFNFRVIKGKPFFSKILKFLSHRRFRKVKFLEGIQEKIDDFESYIVKFYNKDKKHFFYAVIISLVSWLFMFVEYKIVGLMVGVNLNLAQIFLIVSFVGLAYIIPVPMALGTLEASQVSAFRLIGLSSASGLVVSFIVRIKDMIIACIGLIILGFSGLNFKKSFKEIQLLEDEMKYLKKTSKKKKLKKNG